MNPDFRDILSSFGAEGVEFLVVGAYSLAAHGLPRATGDLDLWVRPSPENAERALRALAAFGAPVGSVSAADLASDDVVVQIGVPPSRVDLMTTCDGLTFDEAWTGRLEVQVDGVRVPLLGREALIRNKRAVGRPQDLADVARLEGHEGETTT